MTPTIGSNLIASGIMSGSNETYIEVVNGCFVRQFGVTNWNRLRLAMRYRWREHPVYVAGGGATDLSPNCQFYVGFCNGTSSIPGDQYCQNFIGVCPQDGISFSRNIYVNPYPVFNSNYAKTIRITGNVKTDFGYASGGNYWYQETATGSCGAVFVELQRVGTDNVRLNWFGKMTNSAMGEYYPTANFVIDLMSTTPSRTAYSWQAGYAGTFPHYEAESGSMNAVCVSWNRDHPRVQILDLYVVRIA